MLKLVDLLAPKFRTFLINFVNA